MVVGPNKQEYFARLTALLEKYPKILIVGADNIGSNHMQQIRRALHGKAVILMGKNTMVRKCIRGLLATNPQYEALLPHVVNNVGLVFTDADLAVVNKIIAENKKEAPAKVGAISPVDVIVPAGNTGMEPTQTAFLQALNIPSKISRGTVEIVNDVHLIKIGDKVGASEAALLQKLNLKPFRYGFILKAVYDNGNVFDASVLKITDEEVLGRFRNAVRNIASVSLATGFPTAAAVPHLIITAYKNVLSVSLATEYTFPKAQKIKDYLKNPAAFAAAAPKKEEKKEEKKAEAKKEEPKKKEEKKEEEDDEPMFDLFG